MTRPPRISRTAARPIVCEFSMFSSSMLALSSSAAWVRVEATAASRWAFSRSAASAAARPVSGASDACAASRWGCELPNPGAESGACVGSGAAASQAGACAGALGAALIGAVSAGAADSGGAHESPPSSKLTDAPPGMTTGSPHPVGVDGVCAAGAMGASSKTRDVAGAGCAGASVGCSAGSGSPG